MLINQTRNTSHISQHKSHNRTYTQVSQSTSNLGFKWTDPNKFLELEVIFCV
jgi:hypothetical protein